MVKVFVKLRYRPESSGTVLVISAEDRMKGVVPTVRSTPEAAKCKGHPMVTSNPKDQGKANSSNKEHFSAVARRAPKPVVQNYLPPHIEEEVKPRSKNKRGWVDRNGNPLPDAPPRKKSIINIIQEKEAQEEKKAKKRAQAKEKRNRTIQAKKMKKNEEKIEFGLLRKLVYVLAILSPDLHPLSERCWPY